VAASPSPGSRSPLRVAGIALLGIGVIAAFAGLITTTQGDDNGTVAQAPTSSSGVLQPTAEAALPTAPVVASPAPDAVTPAPQATPFVPGSTADGSTGEGQPPASAPVAAPEPQPAVAAPEPAGGAAGPAPAGGAVVHVPLRVYNNSLVQGLAARAADSFRSAGWTVSEVGGYKGRLLESAAYYRPGTDEEAAAKELAATFGLAAKPRFEEIQGAQPGVIVILIKDYAPGGKS
jgi:hypothetical protein